jgi:hypothetical protein
MVDEIGRCGPILKPLSYHELRNPCLNKELENTNEMLKTNKEESTKYGCLLMSDGWTDTNVRTLINFLVNSQACTKFVKSIDASTERKENKEFFTFWINLLRRLAKAILCN